MKRVLLTYVFLMLLPAAGLMAQNVELPEEKAEIPVPEGYVLADSVVYRPASAVDSTLVGSSVFDLMPSRQKGDAGDVLVVQSDSLAAAMADHAGDNRSRTLTGYRVRIFFDNKQTARAESEATLKRFEEQWHDYPAYRSYVNPYFKVTVGDFRTRSEAMQLLQRLKPSFPAAFIVKETINYPVVDRSRPSIADTIKVLRPIESL
ncbi:MAG: SPOR domain-containing protein [Candidatus Cryptobacteroides sp.]